MYIAKEHFRGQVAPQFAAERARHNDGLEREPLHTRRHITTAALARHYETFAGGDASKHESIIGEVKAKV
jgi:hypothetical protein